MEKYHIAGSLVIQYFEFWIFSNSVRRISVSRLDPFLLYVQGRRDG